MNWRERAEARWGTERLYADTRETGRMIRGDGNSRFHRASWVWFPVVDGKPVNHGLHYDIYVGRISVECWRHTGKGIRHVTITCDEDTLEQSCEAAASLVWEA